MDERLLKRTILAIMEWVYTRPNQEAAMKELESLPNSFEEQFPHLVRLGVVTPKTYEGLL